MQARPHLIHRAAALAGLLIGLLIGPVAAAAADAEDGALPDPLSLDQALALAEGHPRVSASPGLVARLPERRPLYLDCHTLAYGKAAIDPGRGRPVNALIGAADTQRLEILARFFDVLLADLAYARYNEAMAVAYIQFDRAASRRDLGQISDLRVLELESVYQEVLQNRAGSEVAQRLTRALLGHALGRVDALPRELTPPTLPALPEDLPDEGALIGAALAGNPALGALLADGDDADRALVELELTQQVREVLMRLAALAAGARQVATESAYRDLKLDESRTLYDQEVTADLGYSMSQQTMTRMREARIQFCRVLAWGELNALAARPILTPAEDTP
jgi:hypothetical protein